MIKMTDVERAIYAVAFVESLRVALRGRPHTFTAAEWSARAADLSIMAADDAVELHRGAKRRRRG